jgi:sugar lactone lactonase YvrE
VLSGTAGALLTQLSSPRGLARHPNTGALYIADNVNNRVVCYTVGATVGTVAAGGNGPGILNTQLYNPMGLYLDVTSSSLFITNYLAANVVKWTLGASTGTVVAGSVNGLPSNLPHALYGPSEVIFDSIGNMYVADTLNYRIQMFSNSQFNGTTIAGVANIFGTTPNLLYIPYAIAFDSQMNLYVADTANHRIQKFQRY